MGKRKDLGGTFYKVYKFSLKKEFTIDTISIDRLPKKYIFLERSFKNKLKSKISEF
jgi:hypothetical protein